MHRTDGRSRRCEFAGRRDGAIRHLGSIGGDLAALDKALHQLISLVDRLQVVNEAGPCGFVICRHLATQGNDLQVLVNLRADSSAPCKMTAPHFASAAAQLPEVRFAKVDTGAAPRSSVRHRIRSIPNAGAVSLRRRDRTPHRRGGHGGPDALGEWAAGRGAAGLCRAGAPAAARRLNDQAPDDRRVPASAQASVSYRPWRLAKPSSTCSSSSGSA